MQTHEQINEYYKTGLSYLKEGKVDEVLFQVGRIMELNPTHPLARKLFGEFYGKMSGTMLDEQESVSAKVSDTYSTANTAPCCIMCWDQPTNGGGTIRLCYPYGCDPDNMCSS